MAGDQQHNIGQPGAKTPQATQSSPQARARRLSREDERVGEVLSGRFRIIELIGKGGMAVVYKAEDLLLGSTVAIKMLLSHVEEDAGMVERFIREAKASSRVSHPNLMKLLDFGEDESGSPFLVVEYLPGRSLASLQKELQVLGVNNTIHIFTQISEAVGAAHGKGLIHRDLKPSNIMLIKSEETEHFVKVVDFGLAKQSVSSESQQLTQTGEVFGSPLYMSPEQCRGDVVDNRTDIYSLGIMLYEALTGKVPFYGENMVATISKHMTEPPLPFQRVRPDLYIPEKLEAVVMKTLSKSPVDRYASMADFREALISSVPGRSQSTELRSSFVEQPETPTDHGVIIPSEKLSLYLVLALVGLIAIVGVSALFTIMVTQKHGGTDSVTAVKAPLTGTGSSAVPNNPMTPTINVTPSSSKTTSGKGNEHPTKTSTSQTSSGSPSPDKPDPVTPPSPSADDGSKPVISITKPSKPRNVQSSKSSTRTASSGDSRTKPSHVSGSKQQRGHFTGSDPLSYHPRYHKRPVSDEDILFNFQHKQEGKYSTR